MLYYLEWLLFHNLQNTVVCLLLYDNELKIQLCCSTIYMRLLSTTYANIQN